MLLETSKILQASRASLLPIQSPLPWGLAASAALREPHFRETSWLLWNPLSCDGFTHFLSSLPVTWLAEMVPYLWALGPTLAHHTWEL